MCKGPNTHSILAFCRLFSLSSPVGLVVFSGAIKFLCATYFKVNEQKMRRRQSSPFKFYSICFFWWCMQNTYKTDGLHLIYRQFVHHKRMPHCCLCGRAPLRLFQAISNKLFSFIFKKKVNVCLMRFGSFGIAKRVNFKLNYLDILDFSKHKFQRHSFFFLENSLLS